MRTFGWLYNKQQQAGTAPAYPLPGGIAAGPTSGPTGTPTATATTGAQPPPPTSTGSAPQPPNAPALTQAGGSPNAIAAALMASSQPADADQAAQAANSPTVGRFAQPTAASSRGQTSDVWVTVPVDKVEVKNGKGTVTPLYAEGVGYRNSGQGQNIPPTPAAGRP